MGDNEGTIGNGKEFRLYSECCGKPLEGFDRIITQCELHF